MRWLSLALCLLLSSAALAVAETPATQPPRDVVVPEGAAGLTLDEIYEVGYWLREAGDSRGQTWLRAAADMGHAGAARDIALGAYRNRGSNWAAETVRYARIATGEVVGLEQVYFLLAEGGRALDPPVPPAQIDVWYRLSILDVTTMASDMRALRRSIRLMQSILVNRGPFPVRFDALLAEELAMRRSQDPDPYVAAAERACASTLEDSDRLCLLYRIEAGERGHAPSRAAVANAILDEAARFQSERFDTRLAARFLCRNAIEGDTEALERVARLVVETEESLHLSLFSIALMLERVESFPSSDAATLLNAIVDRFDAGDRFRFEQSSGEKAPTIYC